MLKLFGSLMETGFLQFQNTSTEIISYKEENGNCGEEIWWSAPSPNLVQFNIAHDGKPMQP